MPYKSLGKYSLENGNFFAICDGKEIPIKVNSLSFTHYNFTKNPIIELSGYFIGTEAFDPIKKVIFNDPATIVLWNDGTKTVVKCQEGDTYSEELGLAMAISKKFFGNKSKYNEIFKKYIEEEI